MLPVPDLRLPLTTPSLSVRSRIARLGEESPLLLQFVLLSMLLHMLVVLMFGTATIGGARRAEGWLGPLDVTLRQLSPERGSGFTLAPGAEAQPPGAALLQRLESATRPAVAAPHVETAPPAASPAKSSAAAPPAPSPPPAEVRDAVPDVSLAPRPTPADALPRLDRAAPEEVDKPLATPAVTPPKVVPPAPEKEAVPRDFTLPPMVPLERIVPPKLERQLVSPVETRPREVPVAPRAPPVEMKAREEEIPLPAPIEKAAPVKVEREQAPPVEAKPRDVAVPPAMPIERISPAPIERTLSPPIELPAPRKVPVETAAPALPAAAPAPAREAAPRLPTEVQRAPAAPRAAPVDVAPAGIPGRSPAARTETSASGERIRFGAPTPSVEDEIFGTKRDASSAETVVPPAVTVESMKKRAREIAAEGSGSRGVLNLVPPPPPVERKDKLAEDIAKAAKPDCRTAYAGLGILAVVPLVASSVGNNGGCNW